MRRMMAIYHNMQAFIYDPAPSKVVFGTSTLERLVDYRRRNGIEGRTLGMTIGRLAAPGVEDAAQGIYDLAARSPNRRTVEYAGVRPE